MARHRKATSAWRRVRLVALARVVAVLAVGAGVFVGLFVLPPGPQPTTAVPVAAAGPGTVAPAPTPGLVAPTTSAAASTSCPSAQQLLDVFERVEPRYGAGARATGAWCVRVASPY
jgi:hypothetical protein